GLCAPRMGALRLQFLLVNTFHFVTHFLSAQRPILLTTSVSSNSTAAGNTPKVLPISDVDGHCLRPKIQMRNRPSCIGNHLRTNCLATVHATAASRPTKIAHKIDAVKVSTF